MRFTVHAARRRADANSSGVATRDFRSFAKKFERVAFSLFFSAVIFGDFYASNDVALAQNASTNPVNEKSQVLSPEEATGTSIKDFNALRALDPEYIANPDGGDVPVDEDDVWLPDLALAKKAPSQNSSRSVRVISYEEDKTTTEVRDYGVAKPVQKTESRPEGDKTNSVRTANYVDSRNGEGTTNPIRPTQAETTPNLGGFGDYSLGGFEDYSSLSSASDPSLGLPAPVESASDEPVYLSVGPSPNQGVAKPVAPAPPQIEPIERVLTDPTALETEEEPFRETFVATERSDDSQSQNDETATEKPERDPQEIELEAAKLSESDLKKLIVEDVRISGLEMTTQQFNKIVKTRIGARFSQQRLEEDKRALLQTKQFIDVEVSTSWTPKKPDKVIVNFDLTPRRLMRYVKVVGNKKISKHDILEELGIKPGESRIDPYEVENGRLRIIEFYKSKEYAEPHVEILRGDRPEDVGVVYLIDEGINQRVLKTSFVGNTVVSAARLRSLISVKPGVFYFLGGKFTRDRLDADVEKLLEYYRQLGFFDARIDREYQESSGFAGLGKDNAWVSVRYIIDEGPRYKIGSFSFDGNRVLKADELRKKLKVKPGAYYYFNEVEEDRLALKCKYQDLGYVRAEVTPNLVFTDEVGVVDVRYDINEDHRYRVRDVIVDYVGTESRTMTPVVLNMLDLTPGELLNGVKIRQSENTLRQSGYFNDKPSEGQLPEIAVVPDESSVFVTEKRGDSKVVKEARRPKEKDSSNDSQKGDAKTERGQSITRGQVVEPSEFSGTYVPYERAKNAKSAPTSAYLSYAPSVPSESKTTEKKSVFVSPQRPFSSIVRGQTTIPSGFSPLTTRAGSGSSSGYSSYDSSASTPSQYDSGNDYANSPGFQYDSTDENSPAGFSTGVYDSIGDDVLEPITPENDEIYNGDVLIKLQEGRTGMFTASVGVNSDYGLVGNVSFTERNFNLFRLPTNLCTCDGWKDAFRGGGQIFNIQASPGTNIQSYRVSWDVPYVFHTKNTFGVTGLYGDHSFDEWFESRYGGEVRLGRQWTPRFGTTLNAGIYNVKISQPQVTFVPDLNKALGTNREYTIGLSAAYDTRNHPFAPSEGYLVKGTVEEVLGDYQFPRASLAGRYYKTLRKRVDGTGRWVLGLYTNAGWNGNQAPIYERYYGGGSTSLRGFEYRGITPRYLQTGFGIGGNFEFYNSAELLIPVSGGDEFQFALFVDSGTVAEKIDKWGRYRVAPGVGLRFSIPMLGPAPLALDFAFPVSKDPRDVTEVFSFSMSGSR
ncbi:MAG: BamA/TamA family outer membrane protein [Thermoguttaceae bacterium]|nr:BamA/TamA family outer membrane protein [Thermoguttaceae bacterium]